MGGTVGLETAHGEGLGQGENLMKPIIERDYARDLVLNGLLPSKFVPVKLRWRLLRLLGLSVERSRLYAGGFYGGRKIAIGEGSILNHDVFMDASAQITIGRNCLLGMGIRIVTSAHEVGPPERRGGRGTPLPVVIGDGTWVGAGAMILAGVTVGRGCVIAAGAVVTRDCEPNSVYAGVPARKIKDL
jgi:maltose O-acetyltransferase